MRGIVRRVANATDPHRRKESRNEAPIPTGCDRRGSDPGDNDARHTSACLIRSDSLTQDVDSLPRDGDNLPTVAEAMAGDTIVLKAGTFRDSVLIEKTLTIRGAGWSATTITPPAASTSPCNQPGSMEGLCAVGAFDSLGNPDPTKPVKNVSISQLHLTGFADGVFGLNTSGLMVSGVRSDHNTGYGIARFTSTRSSFTGNWVSWNGEAGLYMGETPNAASMIEGTGPITMGSVSSCGTAPG